MARFELDKDMLRISRRSDYGLLFLAYLAKYYQKRLVSLSEVAQVNNLPLPYLRQLALILHKSGLITSKEGLHGGYKLAKSPTKITVSDILQTFEKKLAPVACLDPNDSCRAADVCTTQKIWKTLYGDMLKTFQKTTLQSLI